MTVDINPKVVSTDQLYGVVHIQTREWIDGLMSCTMRRLGQIPDENPKWIILDGDLSTEWVESMNSVMDDNKILTLASNERIPLKPHMKLIFEIRDLRFASPATVSRAGILYISDNSGYQWESYVKAWLQNQSYDEDRKKELQGFFDQYIKEALLHMKRSFKFLVPTVEINMVVSLCSLLQSILATSEVSAIAYVFVFCCVWCLGGGYGEIDGINHKRLFSNWWKEKFKAPRFPTKGSDFDYYVDLENSTFAEWSNLASDDFKDQIDTSKSISNYTVPTVDTIGVQFLMKKLIKVQHSPMLVGSTGCGKTQIMKGLLDTLCAGVPGDNDEYLQ
jgi:dynein heavy chain